MTDRLRNLDGIPPGVALPGYIPADHGIGIVHIGLGAFHKAHQAAYTDDALAAGGGDWRIAGISLRSTAPAEELAPQNGLYTLLERDASGSDGRIVGSIARALSLGPDREACLAALCDPATRIVSLTVTEKGYGLDRATGGIDRRHAAIAADLETPAEPVGLAGLLVLALDRRRAAGTPPFTVLCCDNLPENGRLIRGLLTDFAHHAAPDLVEHIEREVAFPSTMVDRITPARTDGTLADAAAMIGRADAAAVETERFRQWVIEDDFPQGRPAWEAGGALFVPDVRPYEEMKLRMLNGAHSLIAYAGVLAGHRHVRDVMQDEALVPLIRRHLAAAAQTLPPLPDVDLGGYAEALVDRFANPHLAHETYQIAMDGTEKLPQRILAPALDALRAGQGIDSFALVTALWMRYTLGRDEAGEAYALRDPREEELRVAAGSESTADAIVPALTALPGLFPAELRDSPAWRTAVTERLALLLEGGVAALAAAERS